jgi:putative DNA primase/helicase
LIVHNNFQGESKMNTTNISTIVDAFRSALLSDLGYAPNEIIPDGQGRRFSTDGKRGNKDGRYILHLDGFKPAGYYECLRQGIKRNWKYSETTTTPLTPKQKEALYKEIEFKKVVEQQRLDLQHEQVAQRALSIWRKAEPASSAHPYLLKKKVHPYLARLNQEYLLIPLCDVQGKLWSLQYIAPNGDKRFLKGGRKHGLFCSLNCKINELVKRDKVLICEGFATGATLASLEPNQAIMVAFDAGNLMPVVDALLGRFPDLSIEIIADNDRKAELKTGINTGVSKAQAVATKYPKVVVKVPSFPADAPIELSDVNDLVNWQQQQETLKGGV